MTDDTLMGRLVSAIEGLNTLDTERAKSIGQLDGYVQVLYNRVRELELEIRDLQAAQKGKTA